MTHKGLFAEEEAALDALVTRQKLHESRRGKKDSPFWELADAYRKLLKTTSRLNRIADRTEHRLSQMNEREIAAREELAHRNTELETLSKKLSKYLAPQVYNSIFSGAQEVDITSRRKKLTIFFSDLVGFTDLSDSLESEDLTDLINSYLREMSEIAIAHGATIDKYVGDAIMIFFGDPESHGVRQDAVAAVQMAIDMQLRLRALGEIWREKGYQQVLTARMGLHTGYCTVGNFGSPDRMDYTIIGGAVNLASRLEGLCPPGGVLLSYETYAQVRDTIPCLHAGDHTLKGFARPVPAYEVILPEMTEDAEDVFAVSEDNFALNVDIANMSEAEKQAFRSLAHRILKRLVLNSGVACG